MRRTKAVLVLSLALGLFACDPGGGAKEVSAGPATSSRTSAPTTSTSSTTTASTTSTTTSTTTTVPRTTVARQPATTAAPRPAARNCSPAYPDFCIPPSPPDLDCPDIGVHNFTVLPPDPHRFDRDGDGIGCES